MKKKNNKTLYWIGLLAIAGVIYWKWREKQNGDDESKLPNYTNGGINDQGIDYSQLA